MEFLECIGLGADEAVRKGILRVTATLTIAPSATSMITPQVASQKGHTRETDC